MWFKQIQIFQCLQNIANQRETLLKKMEAFVFEECLPTMPYTAGWVSPVDEIGAPLVQIVDQYAMLAMQVEEKILPPVVIQQAVAKKIKHIEATENRKVTAPERYAMKEELTITLLPRAFSKLTVVYAYFDLKNHWLILGTANAKKTEQFLTLFRKTFGDCIYALQTKKLSTILTEWLTTQNYDHDFAIERACVLQDTNQQKRVIRCKEQDLFANNIQAFLKEGLAVTELALQWQDQIYFTLSENLALQSIRFADEIILQSKEVEAGTKQQQFIADFMIMAKTLSTLLTTLIAIFMAETSASQQAESTYYTA